MFVGSVIGFFEFALMSFCCMVNVFPVFLSVDGRTLMVRWCLISRNLW